MSGMLWTRNALCPEGIMWRVFLLDPKPICNPPPIFNNRQIANSNIASYSSYPRTPQPPIRGVERTEGMTACPLKRLLTLLSIPLGFLHAALTVL